MTNSSMAESLNITVDMSNVLSQYGLSEGDYTLDLSFVLANEDVLESCIQGSTSISFGIVDYINVDFGIETEVQEIADIDSDKLQLIEQGESTGRTITLKCNNENISKAYVNISVLKRTGDFTYEKTDDTEITVSTDTISSIQNSQDITVNFTDNVDIGTYRILFELYDEYGHKLSESFESFIVY